jgi:uncharacterized protein
LGKLIGAIWFEEARTVFDDPQALLLDDPPHSGQESRFLLLGFSGFAKLLALVRCYWKENDTIRIISARKATNTEVHTYEESI